MSREELLRLARANIAKKQQKAETEALSRRTEIEKHVPELLVLEGQVAQAGAQAAGMAASGNKEGAAQKLAEVRDITARKEKLLAQYGLKLQDLEPKYACHICNDKGQANGRVCSCVLEEEKRLRREEVNAVGPLQLCRFENFLLDYYPEKIDGSMVSPRTRMRAVLQDCKDYAADFGPRSESLLMLGDAGLGKTHLALSIASEVLEKGYDVIYVSAQNAFSTISSERYAPKSGLFQSMMEADLLVLDDLGTEYIDAYILSKMYELVNERMEYRPTIYTTNILTQEQFNQRYTEKIMSRLLGACAPIRFIGKDIRLQKAGM